MCSQSNRPASPDVYCQLKTIQERTLVHKQLLTTLAPFLTTNDPLYSGNMYTLAHHGLQDSRVDLSHLDLLILNVEDTKNLDIARATRVDIVKSLAQFRTILHLMRSLPDDILLVVFQWCADSHEYHSSKDHGSLDNRHPSWRMSYVCSRWRRLALTSPSLWSVVNIPQFTLNRRRKRREDVIISRLDLQLQRSRNTLLAVIIDDDQPCSHLFTGNDRMVSLLRSTTDRWWYLRISIQQSPDDTVFALCSFENLTHLIVKDDPYSDEDDIPVTAFRHAPRLTHVYSYGEYKIDVNWNKIEVYRTCLFCLAKYPRLSSLRKLTVDASGDYGRRLEVFQGLPPIQLPRLLTLIVFFDDPKILNHLSMPCLETLYLQLPRYELRTYPDLHQCSQHLRNISIVSGQLQNIQLLVAFLAGAPHVTALHLGDNLLLRTTVLRMNHGMDNLFPSLESLRVEASVVWRDGINEELLEIIESRLRVPTPKLRELRIIGNLSLEGLSQWRPFQLTAWEATCARFRSLGIKVIATDTNEF